MNTESLLGRVQRTLIITRGELPIGCGRQFEELLSLRGGPTAATAVVSLTSSEAGIETAVNAALNRISPPDLAVRLSKSGWELANAPLMRLILLLPVEANGGWQAEKLVQSISDQIYLRLGIEPQVLPIWLVDEGDEKWLADCLAHPHSLPLGNMVLSLCNQDGFRLPDKSSLCQITAELLWCLTTTPLLSLIEQRQLPTTPLETPQLMTVGLYLYTWSPEAAMSRFSHRWLVDVLEQWLSEPDAQELPVNGAGWLQTEQFTPKHLASFALREREAALPELPEDAWQMPWPWNIPPLWEKTRFENSIDEEATKAYGKQAQLRLFDPLRRAAEALHAHAYQLLNSQPSAGLAHTLVWIKAIHETCEASLDTVFSWEEAIEEMGGELAETRNILEAQIQKELTRYPEKNHAWLRLFWRPWRWPHLFFKYWRLKTQGTQLCQIYRQQAALRRQKIQQQTAHQGTVELMSTVRHLGSQVEEIREMIRSRLQTDHDEMDSAVAVAEPENLFVTQLPVPDTYYEQLVPDKAVEAGVAAMAIGGLGSQIRHLDDIIFAALPQIAASRLEQLNQITPVELLLNELFEEESDASYTIQQGWAGACPLWHVDAASMDETRRLNQEKITLLCGAEAVLLSDKLPEIEDTVHTLSVGWRRHLWILRLHLGLSPEAGTAVTPREVNINE